MYRATCMEGAVEKVLIYNRLKINDVQHFVYRDDDLPPYLAPGTPKYDIQQLVVVKKRKGNDGNPVQEMKTISGYVGKNKGILQILVERGKYVQGMRGSLAPKQVEKLRAEGKALPDPSLDAPLVLSSCSDFLHEKGALATLVESRGHILILSPKCHPELAGCGIEYAWGKSKQWFRAHNNQVYKDLHRNIENSMEDIVLPISRCWKFERKTRDYRRM